MAVHSLQGFAQLGEIEQLIEMAIRVVIDNKLIKTNQDL